MQSCLLRECKGRTDEAKEHAESTEEGRVFALIVNCAFKLSIASTPPIPKTGRTTV